MRRSVQIVLTLVCLVPVFSVAEDERMAERKRRIMRRYLREHPRMAQSDLEVLEEVSGSGDEELADSEQYNEMKIDLKQQGPTTPMPLPPPPRRPPPVSENLNQLFDDDPLAADPFPSAESKKKILQKKADWPTWGMKEAQSPSGEKRYASWFDRMNKEGSIERGNMRGFPPDGVAAPLRGYKSSFSGKNAAGIQQQKTVFGGGVPNLSGHGQEESALFGSGRKDLSLRQAQSPKWNMESLKSPFSRQSTRPFGSESVKLGDSPYRSPYENRRWQQQQQQRQWGGKSRQEEGQYRRTTPYQDWKKRTSAHDPTADDAYINRLMPKTR